MSASSRSCARAPVPVLTSTDEALAVAREFAAHIARSAVERDADRLVPDEELEALSRTGLLALTVPPAYGGAGLNRATLTEVIRIIAAADPAIAQIPQAHFQAIELLGRLGSVPQRRRFFELILAGARFANALQEKNTERAGISFTRVSAEPGGDFRLNGTKHYTTGALTADWITVLANDDTDTPVFVLVAADADGVVRHDDWRGFGQRSTTSGTTEFNDVVVPADQIIRRPAPGSAPSITGTSTQLIHAAIDVGIARGAFEDGVAYLQNRARPARQSGVERIIDEPHVILHVGRLATRLQAAEALLAWAAGVVDEVRAEPITFESAGRAQLALDQIRGFASEVSLQIASEILDMGGASTVDEALGLDRHWRNARTHTLHDPARWRLHHVGEFVLSGTLPMPYTG